MPNPSTLSPEMERLVALIETNLHFIARNVQSREDAMRIRAAFQTPMGVLNNRFSLNTNSANEIKNKKRLTSLVQTD